MDFRELGEFGFIERVRKSLPADKRIVVGPGDDCAVLKGLGRGPVLLTTDHLIEGVHFRLSTTSAEALGRKALAANLSDIAAMGGTPRYFVCGLGIPPTTSVAFIEALYDGMLGLAERHEVALVGGDTTRSDLGLAIAITVVGSAPRRGLLTRSGARAGDLLLVTGTLGDSALGLALLERTGRGGATSTAHEQLVRRHLEPVPRLDAGRTLAERELASAALDLSDGLASDLTHLARESDVGARVDPSKIPLSLEFESVAPEVALEPIRLALAGGEDYELLFASAPAQAEEAQAALGRLGLQATVIGVLTDEPGEVWIGDVRAETLLGFDHFRDGPPTGA